MHSEKTKLWSFLPPLCFPGDFSRYIFYRSKKLNFNYRYTFLLLTLFLSACSLLEVKQGSIAAVVVEHSHVAKHGGELAKDSSRVTGLVNRGYDIAVLTKDTWKIPNTLGHGFLLQVDFSNISTDIQYFDLKVDFPEMELPNGELRSKIQRKIELGDHGGLYTWYFDFYFDFPYEATPGLWSLTVTTENEVIHTSVFEVVQSTIGI